MCRVIMKICLFKYIEDFTTKNENFQIKKKSDMFHIAAQNKDCGYRQNRLDEAVLTGAHNLCFEHK